MTPIVFLCTGMTTVTQDPTPLSIFKRRSLLIFWLSSPSFGRPTFRSSSCWLAFAAVQNCAHTSILSGLQLLFFIPGMAFPAFDSLDIRIIASLRRPDEIEPSTLSFGLGCCCCPRL